MPMGPPPGAPPGMRSGGPVRGYRDGAHVGYNPVNDKRGLLSKIYRSGSLSEADRDKLGSYLNARAGSWVAEKMERAGGWLDSLLGSYANSAPTEATPRSTPAGYMAGPTDWTDPGVHTFARGRELPDARPGGMTARGPGVTDSPRPGQTDTRRPPAWAREGAIRDSLPTLGVPNRDTVGGWLENVAGTPQNISRTLSSVGNVLADAGRDTSGEYRRISTPGTRPLVPSGTGASVGGGELTPEEPWAISPEERLRAQQARAAAEAQLIENARTEATAVAAPPAEPRNFTKEYTDLLDFLDERPKSKGQLAIDAEIEALRKPVSNRSAMFGAMAAAALKGGEHGFAGTMSRVMDARTPFLSSAETQERENRLAVLGALGKQEENRSAREIGALNTIVGMGDKGRDDLHRDLRLKQEYSLGIKRINSNVKIARMRRDEAQAALAQGRTRREIERREEGIQKMAAGYLKDNIAYMDMVGEEREVAEVEAYTSAIRNWERVSGAVERVDPEGR